MGILVTGLVLVCVADSVALVWVIAHHMHVVGELLDRIVILQGIPPVQRPIPELKVEQEKKEPSNPRDRHLVDRVRFRAGV